MTKAKKALSLILSVVMLFGVLAIGAFANDNTGVTETGTIALAFDKTAYAAGDTIKVTVSLTTDYFAASTSIPVQYDASAVTFVSGTAASTLFGAGAATKTVVNNVTGATNYVALGVLPQSGSGAVAQKANNVELSVLTFTATKAISDTATAFGVLDDQKTMANSTGLLYVGSYKTSDVSSTVYTTGQVLTFPKMTAAPAGSDPVLTGVGTGVVDTANNYVYGVPAGTEATTAAFDAYFAVTDGSYEISGNGTGATLTVKKADGTAFATYTLVIFGDVNGDGAITLADYGLVKDAALGGSLTGAAAMAADVNADSAITLADYGIVKGAALGDSITSNPYI